MVVRLQSQFNGHRMFVAVVEDGDTAARFDDESNKGESAARQWAADEYGIEPESLEWDR